MHEVIEALRANGKRTDNHTAVFDFLRSVNDSGLHQWKNSVGKHFRVNPEVFMVIQE